MKAKNFLAVCCILFIIGSIVYLTLIEYTDFFDELTDLQNVYRQSEQRSANQTSDAVQEAIVQEAVRVFQTQTDRKQFTNEELLDIYRNR